MCYMLIMAIHFYYFQDYPRNNSSVDFAKSVTLNDSCRDFSKNLLLTVSRYALHFFTENQDFIFCQKIRM